VTRLGTLRQPLWRLAVLCILTVGVTVAAPIASHAAADIGGAYSVTVTATKDCHTEPGGVVKQGATFPLNATVVQSGSTVQFTVEGQEFHGSIDADLNYDVPVDIDHWIGHFTLLSNGGASISGQVVGACSGATGPYMNITGQRTSGGPTTTTTTPASKQEGTPDLYIGPLASFDPDNLLGYSAAADLWRATCPEKARERGICLGASSDGGLFGLSMIDEVRALEVTAEYQGPLAELHATVEMAVQLGSILVPVKTEVGCVERPAYPVINGLLRTFGQLFAQGITAAGRHRLDDVEKAVTLADALLALAVTGETPSRVRGSPCPAEPKAEGVE
jgi:hypothetical protein